MSALAGGYILNVPHERRDVLLDEVGISGRLAEPVKDFKHSRQVPLIVFASFIDGKISHIAEGKKGMSAGTGLRRLNLIDLEELDQPIATEELEAGVDPSIRPHLKRVLSRGGLLPPKTLRAFVDRIMELDGTMTSRLARYSVRRLQAIARLRPRERQNLALQKDALGLALDISGIAKDETLAWNPADDATQRSFLDGLPGVVVREDAMLLADFSIFPGFAAHDGVTHFGSKSFEKKDDPSVRLTVIMANRLPLEQQTGADLIYYNETYRSFVMVQYKAMEKGNEQCEFRWQEGDQFVEEIARMNNLLTVFSTINSTENEPNDYRFSSNPFFLKFCPRVIFAPDNKGLFKGIYLPLDLWGVLEGSGRLKGPKGGNLVTFSNVGRRINNSEFATLVSGAWIGTSGEQSELLSDLIRRILETGKTVTYAVRHLSPSAHQ